MKKLALALAIGLLGTSAMATWRWPGQDGRPQDLDLAAAAHPLVPATKAWADDIEKASNGTIKTAIFPSEQLGKAFDHYDMARDGIADVTYVNPGYQPGRFPIIAAGQICPSLTDAKKGTAALDDWYRKYAEKEMKDIAFLLRLHPRSRRLPRQEEDRGAGRHQGHEDPPGPAHDRPDGDACSAAPTCRPRRRRRATCWSAASPTRITFPWGSILLFGIDKVTKYHMDAPLYSTVFVWSMNKAKYERCRRRRRR